MPSKSKVKASTRPPNSIKFNQNSVHSASVPLNDQPQKGFTIKNNNPDLREVLNRGSENQSAAGGAPGHGRVEVRQIQTRRSSRGGDGSS